MAEDKDGNHSFTPGPDALTLTGFAPDVIISQLIAIGVPRTYAQQLPVAISEDAKSVIPSLITPKVAAWILGLSTLAGSLGAAVSSGFYDGVHDAMQEETKTIILRAIDIYIKGN